MQLAALLVIAAAFWGQAPACGPPSIQAESLSAIQTEPGFAVLGLADLDACAITLDTDRLRAAGMACMVAVHEYGHVLGYYDPTGFRWPNGWIDHSHSPDPNNVMYPVMRKPIWPCAW